jgi:beta propeller repeat protein
MLFACLAGALLAPAVAGSQVLVGRETRLTTAPGDQFDPVISGNVVVFTDYRLDNADVTFVDLSDGTEHAVATGPGNQQLADVSGRRIVYTDYGTIDVVLFDLQAGTSTNLTSGSLFASLDPAISGDLVAWVDNRDGNLEIYARDLATGEERRISSSPDADWNPKVSGSVIVWARCDDQGQCHVFAYDWARPGAAPVQLTSGDGSEKQPDIDGRRVAYQGLRDGERDVFVYDLDTGVETRLALPGDQVDAHVSGDFVTFDDLAAGTYHIGLWHLPTGTVFQVTGGAAGQYLNDLDGHRIVYTDDRDGQLDVYLYEFEAYWPPVADAGAPQSIYLGDPATLAGRATDPAGQPIVSWTWSVASSPPGSTWSLAGADAQVATFTPSMVGDYVLSLVAANAQLASAPAFVTVHVATWLPPVAAATAAPESGPAPLLVCFDASASQSPQHAPLAFAWSFGDGTSSPEAAVCHLYGASASPYTATVTVTDPRGLSDSESFAIAALEQNRPPTASPTAEPQRGPAPLRVALAANAADPDGDPLTFAWSFGDGATSAEPDPVHVYAAAGTYLAWLTVSDGKASIARSLTIAVSPAIALDLRLVAVRWWKRPVTGMVTVWADLAAAVPAPADLVWVSLDGVTLLAEPFSAFRREPGSGAWVLAHRGLVARLDFARGRLFLLTPKIALAGLDNGNGVDVEVTLGSATAVDHVKLAAVGRELLLYRRHGCEGDPEP